MYNVLYMYKHVCTMYKYPINSIPPLTLTLSTFLQQVNRSRQHDETCRLYAATVPECPSETRDPPQLQEWTGSVTLTLGPPQQMLELGRQIDGAV